MMHKNRLIGAGQHVAGAPRQLLGRPLAGRTRYLVWSVQDTLKG